MSETVARLAPDIDDAQRRLSGALDAVAGLGKVAADAVVHWAAVEAELAKMRGACEMAAESRELWKRRALTGGWFRDQYIFTDQPGTGPVAWTPVGADDQPPTLTEAVGQAVGSASMAWKDLAHAGVFDDAWAVKVYEGLTAWLTEHVAEQRRQAVAEMQHRSHIPRRGSDVEDWLKRARNAYVDGAGRPTGAWHAFDGLLDDYREHADTGTPLDRKVVGPHEES